MNRRRDEHYTQWMNSREWRNLRTVTLRAHPLCAACSRRGIVTSATEVHHIRPVESGRDIETRRALAFDPANVEPLCHACHIEAHKAMGKGTREENEQRHANNVKEFTEKYFSNRRPGGIFSLTPGGC